MVTVWDYNPGRISGDKTGKTESLMQLVRGMDWEALCLCSQLEFDLECLIEFKNSDLRSKRTNSTVYIQLEMCHYYQDLY